MIAAAVEFVGKLSNREKCRSTRSSSKHFVCGWVKRPSKKVSAAFDGGLVRLREAERSVGLAETPVGCIRDRRNQART